MQSLLYQNFTSKRLKKSWTISAQQNAQVCDRNWINVIFWKNPLLKKTEFQLGLSTKSPTLDNNCPTYINIAVICIILPSNFLFNKAGVIVFGIYICTSRFPWKNHESKSEPGSKTNPTPIPLSGEQHTQAIQSQTQIQYGGGLAQYRFKVAEIRQLNMDEPYFRFIENIDGIIMYIP